MQKTKNYGFNKPESTDFYNVEDFNSAMDSVDTTLKKIEDNFDAQRIIDLETAVTNIQTTSRATLSTAGWYRVAENNSSFNGSLFLRIGNSYNTGCEEHTLFYNYTNDNLKYYPFSCKRAGREIFTKVRHTSDGTNRYLEVYYAQNSSNDCVFSIFGQSSSVKGGTLFRTITPTLTSENIDGVTVISTYDIPANASPVTDLDLEDYYGLLPPTKSIPSGVDLNTYTTVGVYSIATATIANSLSNKPTALTHGGKLVVENTQNDTNFYQTIYSSDGVFRRYISGSTFNEWKTLATTADLANYLPLSGGTVSGNINVNSSEAKSRSINLQNANRRVLHQILEGGDYRLADITNDKDIIRSTANGTTTFNGTATGNLPLNGGGTVTGLTTIQGASDTPFYVNNTVVGSNGVFTGYKLNGTTLGWLGYRNNKPSAFDGVGTRELHHDGNSAKVVVSETPLTAEGSVRIW